MPVRNPAVAVVAETLVFRVAEGAVYYCDASADQTEINAALAYVSGLGGGSVICLQGPYTLTGTINVPANCTLKGVGWGTIFNYDAGGNCITITGDNAKVRDLKVDIVAGAGGAGTRPNCVFADTRTNLELFGLWLIGDETVADDGSDVRQCGIVWDTVTYSSILSCVSQDHKRQGMCLVDSDYNVISDNICSGNSGEGITLFTSDSNIIANNLCAGNGEHGIYCENCNYITMSGNSCPGNTLNGIRCFVSDGSAVSGNLCQASGQSNIYTTGWINGAIVANISRASAGRSGIRMDGSSHKNTIAGNTCYGNQRHGMEIDASSDNTISGNSCNENDSGDTGTYDGINLSRSSANLVSENTCKDNDRWGIMVDADSDFNKVSNNYTSGNTSGSIRVNNANCDKNQIEFNTVEEGAPGNVGTATRSYGNYDPSADAFVGDVGAAPF